MTPTVDVLKTKQSTDRKRWEELRGTRFSDPAHLLRQTIGGLDDSQTPTGGGLSRHFSNHCEAQKLLCLNQSNFNPEFFVFRTADAYRHNVEFGQFRTPEACRDISQVSRFLRTPVSLWFSLSCAMEDATD